MGHSALSHGRDVRGDWLPVATALVGSMPTDLEAPSRSGFRAALWLTALYAVALILALTVPGLDYLALLVLLLMSPARRLLTRRVSSTRPARSG